ncbi:MAG TPA: DUF3710 domain-containing protein [Streptosporangiaceae bacterium]|nr:DUF3710 domain-containing protein [Streptosporangiaceae bacterium]
MFRRRRREEADRPGYDSGTGQDDEDLYGDPDDDEAGYDEPDEEVPGGEAARSGPWDGAGSYPERERIDFGSLLVPAYEGIRVEVEVAEGMGVTVTILRDDSVLQLMAFAAPKTSGLWDEVRQDFAAEVARAGGDSQEAEGPFGVELHARVTPVGQEHARGQLEPIRFLGVDGPRWFLRGMIRGPAARRPDLARPFEDLFADVVVVRGDHPAPPGDLLEIRLPEDMRQALADQFAQETAGQELPNPFERGPEITETR